MTARSTCAVAAVALLLTGSAARAAVPRFSAKIVGNSASGRVAKHAFVVGDGYTGAFRDNRRARTPYRVCWYRAERRVGCKSARTGRVGRDDTVFLIAPGTVGRYEYRWIVAGRAVARWAITIGIGDWQARRPAEPFGPRVTPPNGRGDRPSAIYVPGLRQKRPRASLRLVKVQPVEPELGG